MNKYYIPELKTTIYIPTKEELTEEPDTWWGLIEHDDGYGVDYNWCVEDDGSGETDDCSALYPCYRASNGDWWTDYNNCEPYIINFDEDSWFDSLMETVTKYLKKIMEEDKDE